MKNLESYRRDKIDLGTRGFLTRIQRNRMSAVLTSTTGIIHKVIVFLLAGRHSYVTNAFEPAKC